MPFDPLSSPSAAQFRERFGRPSLDAHDALAALSDDALFHLVARHIDGRPDLDPTSLHGLANFLSRRADQIERENSK